MFNNFLETELTNERWKDIFGYDGMYQVSDLGRVRSHKRGDWRVLRPGKNRDGYLYVVLFKNGNCKTVQIHRLVAQAFIENDNIFNTEINHRNEDKTDNRVDNLEWCDRSYNNTYNGLQHRRYRPQPVRHKIKDLYDPNLTDKENIAIFNEQGIECGRQTLWRLRKDLGLPRDYRPRNKTKHPQPVRNKIKDLYDPNLTYSQNLEIFKANGIECTRPTLWKLRKDLGLTRPYRPRNKAN